MQPAARQTQIADQAGIHIVGRTGAPPFRIRGHHLCQHWGGDENQLWVSLWALSRSGFVVQCSRPAKHGAILCAASVNDITDAFRWVEEVCDNLDSADGGANDLFGALRLQHHRWRIHQFLHLAGRAMADWPSVLGEH